MPATVPRMVPWYDIHEVSGGLSRADWAKLKLIREQCNGNGDFVGSMEGWAHYPIVAGRGWISYGVSIPVGLPGYPAVPAAVRRT